MGRKRGRRLDEAERDRFVELVGDGAAPSGACSVLRVSWDSYQRTRREVEDFRVAVDGGRVRASENVQIALHRLALSGNVQAAKFWLERYGVAGQAAATGGALADDDLEGLTDKELIDAALKEGVTLPPDLAVRLERRFQVEREERELRERAQFDAGGE